MNLFVLLKLYIKKKIIILAPRYTNVWEGKVNRKQRTKIFIDFAQEEVKKFATEVRKKYEVKLVEEPKEGLAMIKVRESAKNSLFYFGEVLITECKVRIDEQVGIGVVKGKDFELSLALAIADAAFELDLPICSDYIDEFKKCEEEGLKKLRIENSRVAKTRVNFNIMNK